MASGTPPPTFLGIPVELRLRILELPALDIRDIIRCMLVCRDLRDLLNGSTLYTYKRELERCSMVDNSPDYPISTKLEKLLDRNRRWRDLDAFSVKTLEVPFVSGPISLLGGIFARTVRGSNKRDLDIGLLVLPKGDGDVEDIIPEGQNWGEVIEAIAIDPEQDLLVVVNGVQQE
ncbi:hypothetical protein SISNIDRAFT_34477 [Sistotremastrum niveocremeum HHB9708]|uniref:F-box domain-containing protein n=2 Tax=Sistotremastraceae TaxID=3402574 RepID=A0A164WA83_9AGAM|nr:hypothetical protein SISNIDRAFT_34477 [Sistotremastrum niveocremeum HHB9708]KZT36882.1 hypothetical protein SISSUDRAFT_918149 [Sistotremastrum suecicum HHB10207 ss-3]